MRLLKSTGRWVWVLELSSHLEATTNLTITVTGTTARLTKHAIPVPIHVLCCKTASGFKGNEKRARGGNDEKNPLY